MMISELSFVMESIGPCRQLGQTVVVANGVYDVLHAGHVRVLREAKEQGDILIVALNADESVRRLKGIQRPLNSLANRAEVIAAIRWVDFVLSFSEETPRAILERIRPEVLVKGEDSRIKGTDGSEFCGSVHYVPFVSGHSSSGLIEALTGHSLCRNG